MMGKSLISTTHLLDYERALDKRLFRLVGYSAICEGLQPHPPSPLHAGRLALVLDDEVVTAGSPEACSRARAPMVY